MKKYIIIPLVGILWALVFMLFGDKASAEIYEENGVCWDTEMVNQEIQRTGTRIVERSKVIEIPGSDEVNHQEFQYKRVVPAVPEIKEYRWYRSYTGPKVIHGFSYVNGSWVSTPGVNGPVPDSLNPPSNLVSGQTGTFVGNNKPYNLPNNPNSISWSYGNGGEQWWPSQDGWATSLNGAPQGAWGNPVASRVRPGTGVAAYALYYLPGGGESTELTDANWTIDIPGEPWVLIAERTVVDQEAVPPSTETVVWEEEEEYTYYEIVEVEVEVEITCPTTTTSTTTTTTPPEETTTTTTTTTVPITVTTVTTPPMTAPSPKPPPELPATGTGSALMFTVAILFVFVGGTIWLLSRPSKND